MVGRARAEEPWIDDEPRFGAALQLVTGRALRRAVFVVGVTAALTVAFVVMRLARLPSYEATDYFRMSEGEVTDASSPPPPREIREYIAAVALSHKTLLEIMTKHGLYKKLLDKDPIAAVATMREDIGIVVARNYFVFDRDPEDEPRSASVMISYSSGSGEVARDVVHALGQAVLDAQEAQRTARLRAEKEIIRLVLEHEHTIMRGVQAELDLLSLDAFASRTAASAQDQAQLASANQRMKMSLDRVQRLEKRSAELDLATSVETSRLGLTFQLVDEDTEVEGARLTVTQVVRLAVLLFLCVGGVTLGVVGGWGRRVYRVQDLFAAGVPVFGRLSHFVGDDVGAYRARAGQTQKKPGIMKKIWHG